MIHTEHGRLDELISVVSQDRLWVLETLGRGPSGQKSRDKNLKEDSPRFDKLLNRARDLTDILALLEDAR